MPLFKRSVSREIRPPRLNCIPPSPSVFRTSFKSPSGAPDVSRTSIVSTASAPTCDWFRSEQACVADSKSEVLGHALHLARLAVILDRAQVYTGAARAYFDCCYVLSTVETELGDVELDITNQISQTYKQRLAYLCTRVAVSSRSSLSFPSHMIPAQEFHIDLSPNSKQHPHLVELNRICQLLRTLGHCCEIIQEVGNAQCGSEGAHDTGVGQLLDLSAEFQKSREDMSQFRSVYSSKQLATGEASNVLFVLLGAFKIKVDTLVKGGNKDFLVFLLSLFDLQLPAECEAEAESKPLPPQPLHWKKPSHSLSKRNTSANLDSPVSPLTVPKSVESSTKLRYARTLPEDGREPIQLAPVPVSKRYGNYKRPTLKEQELAKGAVDSTVPDSPDTEKIDEKMAELIKSGTFLLV